MGKNKNKIEVNNEAVGTVVPGNGFRDYLRFNNNIEALQYIEGQEQAGHKLPIKGAGAIGYIVVDSIFSYDIFKKDENKALYARLLQEASNEGKAIALLCYNIIDNSAHIILKGDNKKILDGFVALVNARFAQSYQQFKEPLGYPFRLERSLDLIMSKSELINKMSYVYGLSDYRYDEYPYNSYNFLLKGDSISNMVLGVELDIIRQSDYINLLLETVKKTSYAGKGVEKLKTVMKEEKLIYLNDSVVVREGVLAFCITEAAARSQTPYGKVAKLYNINLKRHDFLVSALADFIVRREFGYFEAINALNLGESFDSRLIIETFIEIHRITLMPYTYIVENIMKINDSEYSLVSEAFKALNRDRGMNFAELCEDYYITKDILKIRALCQFE